MSYESLTKLHELLWTETSSVDDPAHQTPGWLVMKSVAGTDPASEWIGELHANVRALQAEIDAGKFLSDSEIESLETCTAVVSALADECRKEIRKRRNRQRVALLNGVRAAVERAAAREVEKAHHHPVSGRFVTEAEAEGMQRGMLPIRHSGAVLRVLGGKA